MKKITILITAILLALTLNFGFAHFAHTAPAANLFTASAPVAKAASWSGAWDEITDAFSSEDLTEVSFEDFEGGLQAPSKEGYAEGLTQVSSARELIVKIVNFALGFLGLIAIVIIIYGGVRYVTSAGESEGVEKGKKSIMYAAIGLIIIISSYAIVNTILQAPSGTDQPAGTSGGALSSTSQTMMFSVDEIKNIPITIASVYNIYSKNNVDFLALEQGSSEIGKFSQFDSVTAMQKTMQSIEAAIKSTQNRLTDIARRSSKTSAIQERASQYTIYTNSWLANMNSEVASIAQAKECTAPEGSKCTPQGGKETDCKSICKQTISAYYPKFKASIDSLVNYLATGSGTPAAIQGKIAGNFMDISFKTFKADNDEIVNSVIDKIKKSLKDLRDSVSVVSSDAEALFAKIDTLLDSFKNPSGKETTELKTAIVSTIESVQELQKKLVNIKFVQVVLTADSLSGNAPFIVNFNTAGTIDPSNKTVQGSQIHWDLDGNGTFGEYKNSLGCEEKSEAASTCVYKKAGTYRTAVKVDSSDKNIAGGIAYVTIKVLPPKARIELTATVYKGGAKVPVKIMDYDEEGFLLVDRPRLQVTLTQAKNGIEFDASGTTSTGTVQKYGTTADTIQRIKWDFGDRTETVEGDPIGPNLTPKHYYSQIGEYPVTLEVTDKNSIKDRKLFTVSVSSIAALIDISPIPVGKTQTLFMMSGDNSSSENGQITGYEWNIAPDINNLGKIDKSAFSSKFGKPNTYMLTLKVQDNQGNEATDQAEIKIESAAPVAKFSYSAPKANQPAMIQFDGTKTYDPDGPNKDIIYLWSIEGESADYKFVSGDASSAKPLIKFNKIGTYKATLRVNDKNEPEKSTESTQEISITNLLDIEWGAVNTSSLNLDENGEAEASFSAVSEHAAGYDFEFGDSEIESGIPSSGKIQVSHTYKKSGAYKVKLTVTDDENNKNSITRKTIIGGAKNPVAVIKLLINNEEYSDTSALIEISRKDVVTFDASGSINTDGTKSNLKYQWDFGDAKKSTKEIATYTYKELSKKAPYEVLLKITDSSDPTKFSTDNLKISVVSMKPTLKSITAIPEAMELKTPLKVNLSAIEPSDPDGRIVSYKWWYFDVNNPEERFAEQITTVPNTMLTIGTKGNEGDSMKYEFSVAMTDDENQTVSAEEALGIESLPTLDVVNGPNKPPAAKFSVDKTSIKVGESITFSSSSSDPDGKIATYIWDTDGEGFAGKTQTQKSTITALYDKPAPEGIIVRLKVIDDNYAESISEPITIYVLSKSAAPKAAFTSEQVEGAKDVKFKNNSTADADNDAKIENYIWDFDIMSIYPTADSDGDSKKDNDTDSTEKDPKYTYPAFGTFYAKLTVIDNVGNKNTVINPVILKSTKTSAAAGDTGFGTGTASGLDFGKVVPGVTGGTTLPQAIQLKVKTSPAPDAKDGKIHLAGTAGWIEFSFAESTGNIVKIIADKNIYFDSDNNGAKDDDANFSTQSKATPWKTDFQSSWGKTAVKFTAYDKNNNYDTVIKEVVFDATTNAGSTNVFVVPGSVELYAALASMFGFGIVGISAFRYRRRR
ncbi:hypothetical protein HZA39_03150 [Candidatus Peregrinibacteria bacterium]|nr:hypothetical protein [Candidatus Peregrinibacteria bacterium]